MIFPMIFPMDFPYGFSALHQPPEVGEMSLCAPFLAFDPATWPEVLEVSERRFETLRAWISWKSEVMILW